MQRYKIYLYAIDYFKKIITFLQNFIVLTPCYSELGTFFAKTNLKFKGHEQISTDDMLYRCHIDELSQP